MLPKQMLRYVLFVAVRDATAIAEMQQLMLPYVSRELCLRVAILKANITGLMLLAHVHHESKGGGQWCRLAEAATELHIEHVACRMTRTNVAQKFAIAEEIQAAHATRDVGLNVQPTIVRIQFLMGGCHIATLKALVYTLIERLNKASIIHTAHAHRIQVVILESGQITLQPRHNCLRM